MRTQIEGIKVEGIAEAVRRVRSLMSALESKDVEDVLVEGARIVRNDARRRVRVRTGKLKRALKARRGKRRAKAFAIAFAAMDLKVAPHGYLVEYGTRRMAARPYFRPAVDATKNQVRDEVSRGIARLIGRAVR